MPKSLRDWLKHIEENHPDTIDLGLERVAAVWHRMGRPRPAPRVITVGGTNGKGSTVAGIEAGLLHLGRRTGCFTSPHLLHYHERIHINGSEADEVAIIRGFEAVNEAQDNTRLTYFEFATLAAIATLAHAGLDVAILEVGLGGRLDAVNVIDADIGVLTTIGLDHQEFLGSDRESIGREKAGIMRPGQFVVCSDREPPISIFDAAEAQGVSLIRLGADFEVTRDARKEDPGQWQYFYADESAPFPMESSMPHLADNLAGALTAIIMVEPGACEILDELAPVVANSRVRGRLERVATGPDVILDVGHNPLAAQAINEFLQREGRISCRVVIGMLEDKDAEGVAAAIGASVSRWYCCGLEGPRGQTGLELANRIQASLPGASVVSCSDVATGLQTALQEVKSQDTLLVFGSFLTVSQAMQYLES